MNTPAAGHVEAFALEVHRAFVSPCRRRPRHGLTVLVEVCEVRPGTYPARTRTNPAGHVLAVVDLDVTVTRRTTWRWFGPRTERPYTPAVSQVAWSATELVHDAPAVSDDDGTPLATWRRLPTDQTRPPRPTTLER
ncbi:hypothetical protein [Antribacter gilvus]|uniref:hypothetical protein n=1 Tax=Antribacter gilvus TaxID=2304675 RepID=UPI000F769171|nr:hypothetical protein [Antribacter gilvus]